MSKSVPDPFKETTQKADVTIPEAVEEIDIGG
jgi:AICAR transformylase/IMP cyclohydrolase PurH